MVAYLNDSNTIQAYNATSWVTVGNAGTASYNLAETVYFPSSGTFTKATYPWLRAIKVKCVGGGGGGGGSGTTASAQASIGTGGNGGSYGESFITDIAGLASSITITVGAGGSGAAAGNNNGSAGGNSSFGSLVIATGGKPGAGGPSNGVPTMGNAIPDFNDASTAQLVIEGSGGSINFSNSASFPASTISGFSALSRATRNEVTSTGFNGMTGRTYGGGGGGALNAQSQGTTRSGGTGGNGILILELYA
jgi:hypothetical protein